jgi:hypothetical protein
MGIRCFGFPPHAFPPPKGLTTLDTSLPAQCAMATPSLDQAIPRQGVIQPLMWDSTGSTKPSSPHGPQNDATRSLSFRTQGAGHPSAFSNSISIFNPHGTKSFSIELGTKSFSIEQSKHGTNQRGSFPTLLETLQPSDTILFSPSETNQPDI